MDRERERILALLDGITQQRLPSAVELLTPAYVRGVERLEGLELNRSRADKTWVHEQLKQSQHLFERARRVR